MLLSTSQIRPSGSSFIARLESRLKAVTTGWFLGVVTVAIFALFATQAARSGRLPGPPRNTTADETDYDNIAVQIRAAGVFGINYDEPIYFAPYERAEAAGLIPPGFRERVSGQLIGLTTYRPPVIPALLALTFGSDLSARRYDRFRLINYAAAAITVGAVGWVTRRAIGATAALIGMGLIFHIVRLQSQATTIMTESLCGMLVSVALGVLVLGLPRWPIRSACCLGLIWAAAILTRTALIFWVPPITLGIGCVTWRFAPRIKRGWLRALAPVAWFLSVTVAGLTPWAIRNCLVLQAFMPLGCQGFVELPAGFSDEAVRNEGIWTPLARSTQQSSFSRLPDYERSAAEEGRERTLSWIRRNPAKLPRLTLLKVWNEWKPSSTAMSFALFAAVIGFGSYRRTPFAWACLALLAGDLLMIMATWSVDGNRFIYPALAAFYSLAGAGAWAVIRLMTDLRPQLDVPPEASDGVSPGPAGHGASIHHRNG